MSRLAIGLDVSATRIPLSMVFLLSATTACGPGRPAETGAWRVEREMVGDTQIVRTLSGSVWGESAHLVDELVIGALNGAPEYEFGRIGPIAVDGDGGIYVFDSQGPELRYYSADGTYVRSVGREGRGPGEYTRALAGMAIRRSDGHLLAYDPGNARIDLYDSDGSTARQWRVGAGLITFEPFTLDTADEVYVKIVAGALKGGEPVPPIGVLHLDTAGRVVDTLLPPHLAGEPDRPGGRLQPEEVWAWSPLGYFVAGVNRTYTFDLRPPGDAVTRVERATEPVPVLPGERRQIEAAEQESRKTEVGPTEGPVPSIPDTKPAYGRFLLVGQGGRVWIQPHVRAERVERDADSSSGRAPSVIWSEPMVFDVFEPDGTYLGRVPMRAHTLPRVVRGDLVWGVRTGEYGESYVVRMRVVHG